MKQTTISREISFSGVGLHTGHKVRVFLKPALIDSGYVFKRLDLPESSPIAAIWSNVICTENRTVLGKGLAIVNTVEHLLSALVGCGVDNCLIEVNGNEIPDLDGAALKFSNLIRAVGIVSLSKDIASVEILVPIIIEKGDSFVACLPADGYFVSNYVDFGDPEVFSFEFSENAYFKLIAPAKTIGSWAAVQSLWKKKLAWGGSFSKVRFVDEEFSNFNTQANLNEVARHKVLDFIGDLALFGARLKGRFFCYKAGHGLHFDFIRQLSDLNCHLEKHDLAYNKSIIEKVRRIWG